MKHSNLYKDFRRKSRINNFKKSAIMVGEAIIFAFFLAVTILFVATVSLI